MDGFTVYGTLDGTAASITWSPDGGFTGDTGRLEQMIRLNTEVSATPTGPTFTAAASPAEVALLSAVHALDTVESIDGGEAAQAALDELCAVPADASP